MSSRILVVLPVTLLLMASCMLTTLSLALVGDLFQVNILPILYLLSSITALSLATFILLIIVYVLVRMAEKLWGYVQGYTRITMLDGLGKPTTYGGEESASLGGYKMDATTWRPSGCKDFARNTNETESESNRY